jgi:hypothetical protein
VWVFLISAKLVIPGPFKTAGLRNSRFQNASSFDDSSLKRGSSKRQLVETLARRYGGSSKRQARRNGGFFERQLPSKQQLVETLAR